MAVAFDAVAIPAAALYTATFSWTHTPVGTPRGVAVVVVQEGSTDQVSGVTYGGLAMTRVRTDVRTATEAGRVYIYFLGSGLPAGAQTVEVTLTGTADTNGVSLTVTAADNTAVDTSNGVDAGIIANPSLSITPTVAAMIFYGIFSGLAAPVTTVETGSTHVAGKDYGTDSAMWARKSVAAGGGTTIGYTASSDDVCHSALAIKESAAQTFYQSLPAAAIGVGGLTKLTTMYRTLPATATGIAVVTYAKMFTVAIAAVAQGVAVLARVPTYVQALAASVTGVATLSKVSTFYRSLVAVATGVTALVKVTTFYRSLVATVTGVAVLTEVYTAIRTLGATVTGTAGLVPQFISGGGTTFYQTLNAVATGVASLSTRMIEGGEEAVRSVARYVSTSVARAFRYLVPGD